MGGYSNKGGTAPGYKTLKATDGRDSSGCATIHGFARGSRQIKAAGRADGTSEPGLRIASDLSRGMQECAIITQRCGPTVPSAAYAGCAISPGSFCTRSGRLLIPVGKSAFEGETEMDSSTRGSISRGKNNFCVENTRRGSGIYPLVKSNSRLLARNLNFADEVFNSSRTIVRHLCFRGRNTRGHRLLANVDACRLFLSRRRLKVRCRRAFDRQHCLRSNHRFVPTIKTADYKSSGLTRSRQWRTRDDFASATPPESFAASLFYFFSPSFCSREQGHRTRRSRFESNYDPDNSVSRRK